MVDITILIRADHDWFREQFAKLDSLRAKTPADDTALDRVWGPLAEKLDVHGWCERTPMAVPSGTAPAGTTTPGCARTPAGGSLAGCAASRGGPATRSSTRPSPG